MTSTFEDKFAIEELISRYNQSLARYEDDLKRVDGHWRFARRKLHQDMPLPATAS